jgi:hypothetical protein
MRAKLGTMAVLAGLAFGVGLYVSWPLLIRRSYSSLPYAQPAELLREIRSLPEIRVTTESTSAAWVGYVSLGNRFRNTNPSVIEQALKMASADGDPLTSVKVMILLRVCFECPGGKSMPKSRGGWISHSEMEKGRVHTDMNWPVRYAFGRFVLTDSVDGYLGEPYDVAAEYQWRIANCHRRQF